MRNPATGLYEPDYTDADMQLFMDLIKQGTTQAAFLKEIQKLFPENSMWAILKWYTLAKKKLEEKHDSN